MIFPCFVQINKLLKMCHNSVKDLIVKEGLLTNRLLCRVETQDSTNIIYLVFGGGLKFEGVNE